MSCPGCEPARVSLGGGVLRLSQQSLEQRTTRRGIVDVLRLNQLLDRGDEIRRAAPRGPRVLAGRRTLVETEIVRYAAKHQGKLSMSLLYPAFVATGQLGEPALRKLLAGWEEQELAYPSQANRGRRLSAELAWRAGVTDYEEAE